MAWRRAGLAGVAILFHAALAERLQGAVTNLDVMAAATAQTIQLTLNDEPMTKSGLNAGDWPPYGITAWSNGIALYGTQVEMRFGMALAPLRPTRDGGQALLAFSSPRLSYPVQNRKEAGAVFLFEATAGVGGLKLLSFLECETALANFGQSLANAGDTDGNGYDDLLVGAPNYKSGATQGGMWRLFPGPAPWRMTSSNVLAVAERKGARKGQCVASAGDVNGDGFPDMLIASPNENMGQGREGTVSLHFGSTRGVNPIPDWSVQGRVTGAAFGNAMASAGDVNQDGFADLLIGAPRDSSRELDAGRVDLYFGSPTGPGDKPGWSLDGPVASSYFGDALASLGDINGDGFDDVIVGAPGSDRSPSDWPGAAFIYLGSTNGLSKTPAMVLRGESPGSTFGVAFATGGDADGDHRADLLIGAPRSNGRGRVYLFPGRAGGVALQPSWILDGGKGDATCGRSLAFVPDVDGDGRAEILVGSPRYTTITAREGRADLLLSSLNSFRSADFDPDAPAIAESSEGKTNGIHPQEHGASGENNHSVSMEAPRSRWLWLAVGLLGLAGIAAWNLWSRNRAVAGERQRFARELHDDMGSRLTHISALTEMVRRESTHTEEGKRLAQLLSKAAQEVLESMEEVIWSVNPDNDTLANLVVFIVQYAGPFLAPSGIELNPESPTLIPNRRLTAALRKNVFLSVKEVLNNVVKHSQAQQVDLQITCDTSALTIVIADDGKGFEKSKNATNGPSPVTQDGLKNLQARMTEMRGSFGIEDRPEGGTRVTLRVPL